MPLSKKEFDPMYATDGRDKAYGSPSKTLELANGKSSFWQCAHKFQPSVIIEGQQKRA